MVLLIILASGCAAQPVPVPPSPAPTTVSTELAWQDDWDNTVAAARNEGKLVIYTTAGTDIRPVLVKALKEKFGIDIEWVTGRGAELTEKLLAERRAGLYLADLYFGGTGAPLLEYKPAGLLTPLKSLLVLPEVVDTRSWFENELPFIDKEGMYTVSHGLMVSNTLAVNSDLVKAGELKGYADLLDPKWKDRIILSDPTIDGTGYNWFMVIVTSPLTADFHRQLVKLNPLVTRDKRLQVEWVARGKYSLALAPPKEGVAEFQKIGAPLKWVVPVEGVYVSGGGGGSLSHFDKAPHPKAAKVFANWFLSKEGLTIWSQTTLQQTAREDIPSDFLPGDAIRSPGAKYFNVNKEEVKLQTPEMIKLAKEIYGALLK